MITDPVQPLTHARVLRIALPIVLSGATVPLVGAVDTAVVGQTADPVPIGAVGISAVMLSAVYWIFSFLRMGTTGLVGQAMGAGDRAEVSALLSRALVIGLVAGFALTALQPVIFALGFAASPASAQVEASARDYLGIRIWTAPAAIGAFALTGWLVAMERTLAVLLMQLVVNVLNATLDLWFVLGLDWGVPGVAIATAIAETAGLLMGLYLCRDAFRGAAWRDWSRILDRARLLRMALVNLNIFLRSACLLVISVSFSLWGARFGDITLAANQVLMQFLTVSAFMLDGFAYAAEALIARAVGRRDTGRLRRSVWLCWIWSMLAAVLLAGLIALLGPAAIDLLTKSPDVQSTARAYLIWVSLTPLLGATAFALDGVFLGATRGADLRNMMALSLAVYLAAVALLMPAFGNHGLWLAILVSFVARALTLAARYPALERDLASKPVITP